MVGGDWQAVIGNYFTESRNSFVPLGFKLRLYFLFGPHDAYSRSFSNGVIRRPTKRVPFCKRPQISVFVHRGARYAHRDGSARATSPALSDWPAVLGRASEVIEYTFCSAVIEGRKVSLWVMNDLFAMSG
jgi:hypothetical protein